MSRDLFQAPRDWLASRHVVGGPGRAGAPLLATDVALRLRVEKYIECPDAHVLMRFSSDFEDSRQHSPLIVDSSV